MCSVKTPKAPANQNKQPRVLLSRRNYDDLLITRNNSTSRGDTAATSHLGAGVVPVPDSGSSSNGGGPVADGLRIVR